MGIGLPIIFALTGGYIIGLKAQKRIFGMEQALNAVTRGKLRRRVPRSAMGDDIDHVSGLINLTLDRLEGLIGNLKQVTVDIAHGLRTPISRMRQKLENVRAGPDSNAAYKSIVGNAIDEIDGIADTFDALLRISEIEAVHAS